MNSKKIIALVCVILLLGFVVGACNVNTETGACEVKTPKDNKEIRQWYNQTVSMISVLNDGWIKAGFSPYERAKRAFQIRRSARLMARAMMMNAKDLKNIRDRDYAKYSYPDGPTFPQLVEKIHKKDSKLTLDQIYEQLIDSSKRTSAKYNKKSGIKTTSEKTSAKSGDEAEK
ncbi:MAG: hypothetical protein GY757_37175 [bacterium]|nr:hypothetical protein [bacterium]